jgi:hypothetical protein
LHAGRARFDDLLDRVARRQRVSTWAGALWMWWLILAGAYLLPLLAARLLGVLPTACFTPRTLLLVPLAGMGFAFVFRRAVTRADAARLVDAKLGTHDLFLTATCIDGSLGGYQNAVLAQADAQAATARPAQMLPWQWPRSGFHAVLSLGLLYLCLQLLPQCDPFGLQQERRQQTQQQARLRDTVRATALRAALIEQQAANVATDQVPRAVADLLNTFNQARPADRQGTFNRLGEQQRILGQLWRQAGEEKLRNALNRAAAAQSFGLPEPARAQQWQNELRNGDMSGVSRELDELKALARQLGETGDALRREELRQELASRLRGLQQTLAAALDAQPVNAALDRALEQLALACSKGVSQEALRALANSLNLTAAELAQLAQAARDLLSLEEALKALQAAKRLQGVKPLDGKQCGSCSNACDYAALFNAQYAAACSGRAGVGMGPGQGVGPRPSGDEALASSFQSRQSPSAFQPGQILLSWKTREVSESGQAVVAFRQALEAARQDASEAIVQERVPPAYHVAVKAYFDELQHEKP